MHRKSALFSLFVILFVFCLPNVFSAITITNSNPANNTIYPKGTSQINATCLITWSSGFCSTEVVITKRFIDPLTGSWTYANVTYNNICGARTIPVTLQIPSPPTDLSGNTIYWGCDVYEPPTGITYHGDVWQMSVLDTAPPYTTYRRIDGQNEQNYVVPSGNTQVNISATVTGDSSTYTTVYYVDGNQYCYTLVNNNTRKDCIINLAGLTGTDHTWKVGMKDTYTWYNSSTWYFYTESGNAIPTFNSVNLSPGMNVQVGQNLIINVNATDAEADTIYTNVFCNYPTGEQGWTTATSRTCYGWSSPGTYKVRVYIGDVDIHGTDINTYNYREYNILVGNANVPIVTLRYPGVNTNFITNSVEFGWNTQSDNSATVNTYLYIDDSYPIYNIYGIPTGDYDTEISGLSYGNHEWYVCSEDSLGLIGCSSTRNFFIGTNNSCPYFTGLTVSSLNVARNQTVYFTINATDPETNLIYTDIQCNYLVPFVMPNTWVANGWSKTCTFPTAGTYTVRIDLTDSTHGFNLSGYEYCPHLYRVVNVGNYTIIGGGYDDTLEIPTDSLEFLSQIYYGLKGFFSRWLYVFMVILLPIVILISLYTMYQYIRKRT